MAQDNIDPQEVAKFEAMAHRWWDPEGDFRPLHDLNPLRCQWIADRAPLAGAPTRRGLRRRTGLRGHGALWRRGHRGGRC